MNHDELSAALMERVPVIYDGMEYDRIGAIIYRNDESGRLIIQAELKDVNGNSVTIVNPKKLKRKGNLNEDVYKNSFCYGNVT